MLSVRVVFPLLVFMLLGYSLKRLRLLSDVTVREVNALVFRVFLPIVLFCDISQSNLAEEFNGGLLVYAIFAVILTVVLLCLIVPRFEKNKQRASVIIQGIYRSNFVLFGIPVTRTICGADHMGMIVVMVAVAVPLFNVSAVILFELFRGEKFSLAKTIKGVATNPLILAAAAGLLFFIFGWQLPSLIQEPLEQLGDLATPLALVILGATFTFSDLRIYAKQLTVVCLGKLIVVSAIFVSIGILLGFRGSDLTALLVLFASPAAVSSFTMASQMGGDEKLAGDIVVLTSVFSILTIFAWTFLLSSFSLI